MYRVTQIAETFGGIKRKLALFTVHVFIRSNYFDIIWEINEVHNILESNKAETIQR